MPASAPRSMYSEKGGLLLADADGVELQLGVSGDETEVLPGGRRKP